MQNLADGQIFHIAHYFIRLILGCMEIGCRDKHGIDRMIRFIDCIVDQHDDIGDIIIRKADFQAGFHFLDRCQRNTVQAGKTMLDILTEIVPFGYGEGLLRLLFLDKETHIMDKSLTDHKALVGDDCFEMLQKLPGNRIKVFHIDFIIQSMVAEDDELSRHASDFQSQIGLQTVNCRIKQILSGSVLIVIDIQLVHDILFHNNIALANSAQRHGNIFHKLPVVGIRECHFQIILHIL